jgi:hypothetical protein
MFQETQKSTTISSGPCAVHWAVGVCGGVLRVTAMYSCMNANGASRSGSNPTTTVKQLFDLMADLSGLPAPRMKALVPVVRVAAAVREFRRPAHRQAAYDRP